ncbi:MSMEG_0565 family glycosyltransferase [Plastoroseomonas arctica]|uniref:MSMEG_0565 family glycosyltransferase n=1 Tax=Plastoroseomonas arctica TaxID=1509237 RepID=A0AAF1KKP3_9PROT|nr:MSMEG_0565 family glycosyltransferase [Plastoroseomonas arctica]MBR0656790.1 MSMEG_0565 family glycosyltransferase [Plastoroseomonas arctica]
MRIAILAHSTNPRGGVVHAMHLAEALCAAGHEAVLHAPDAAGQGFFRTPDCPHEAIPVAAAPRDILALVEQRRAEYAGWFTAPARRSFDVFHAQDALSGNALADLHAAGLIDGFARTVHHIDDFADPGLMALQARAVTQARALFTVSEQWRGILAQGWGRDPRIVGNGVDAQRFTPRPDGREAALRRRWGLGAGPVFLAIGGAEARKNTLGILDAFIAFRSGTPSAQLLIAGGASLLDHGAYQARFAARLAAAALPAEAVILAGPVEDAEMPALYRLVDALVFPSLKEGFGLVVLEALASGIPAIVPRLAPFTEFLRPAETLWCDPKDSASITAAMAASLDPERRAALAVRGHAVVARHGWDRVAAAQLDGYRAFLEQPGHA